MARNYTNAGTAGKPVKHMMALDKTISDIGTTTLQSDDYQGMIVFTANGIVLNGYLVAEPNGALESSFEQKIKDLTENAVFQGALVEGYLLLNSNDSDSTEKEKKRFFSSNSNDQSNLLEDNADEGKIYYDKKSGSIYFYISEKDEYVTVSEMYSLLGDTYLTKTDAEGTYLTKTDAKDTYVTTKDANSALNSFKREVEETYAAVNSPALTGTPKAPTASSGDNSTQIATTAFVQGEITSKIAAADAMIYKGTIGTDGTVTALPSTTAQTGWTYKVITAGTYAGQACEVGDMIICLTDGSSSTAATWTVVQSNLDGAVTGPSSSVNGNLAVFSGTTGKVIKDGGTIEAANPTLSFGGTSALGNVGSTTFKITMPALPTKADIGLSNVDNTADKDKVVAQATKDGNGDNIAATYLKKSSITTSLSSSSTDAQVPSAKAVYDGTVSVWTGTQAEYDSLATKDDRTVYLVTDDEVIRYDYDMANFLATNITRLSARDIYTIATTLAKAQDLTKTVYVHCSFYNSIGNDKAWRLVSYLGTTTDSLQYYADGSSTNSSNPGYVYGFYSETGAYIKLSFQYTNKDTAMVAVVSDGSAVVTESALNDMISDDATSSSKKTVPSSYALSLVNTKAESALSQLTWYTEA